MAQKQCQCPFTYSNGTRCNGIIQQARVYSRVQTDGPTTQQNVRKYRLWCSKGWDHAGAVASREGKRRMEFYPDHLPPGLEDALWTGNLIA